MKPAREPASTRPKPCASLKNAPGIMPFRHSLLTLVGRKQTLVRDQVSPQKRPGSRLWFSCTGVQHSHGSSTIELPSALAEGGACSPNRTCHGTLACAAAPYQAFHDSTTSIRRAPNWSSEEAHPQPTKPPSRINRPAASRRQPVGVISSGLGPILHRPERPSYTHAPKPVFSESVVMVELEFPLYWVMTYV